MPIKLSLWNWDFCVLHRHIRLLKDPTKLLLPRILPGDRFVLAMCG